MTHSFSLFSCRKWRRNTGTRTSCAGRRLPCSNCVMMNRDPRRTRVEHGTYIGSFWSLAWSSRYRVTARPGIRLCFRWPTQSAQPLIRCRRTASRASRTRIGRFLRARRLTKNWATSYDRVLRNLQLVGKDQTRFKVVRLASCSRAHVHVNSYFFNDWTGLRTCGSHRYRVPRWQHSSDVAEF